MTERSLEEEVDRLRAENQQLREQLGQALALVAQLQQELERLRSEKEQPPSFVKPNTAKADKAKETAEKQSRRKRAKD